MDLCGKGPLPPALGSSLLLEQYEDQLEEGWNGAGPRYPQQELMAWQPPGPQRQQRPASASAGTLGHRKAAPRAPSFQSSGSLLNPPRPSSAVDFQAMALPPKRKTQRPSSAPAARRPSSAPAVRRQPGAKPKPEKPQVNMNKVAPLGQAPRWTIPHKTGIKPQSHKTPGPGAYDFVRPDAYWSKRAPSCSMGKTLGSRAGPVGPGGPGPANYNVRGGPKGPKWVIAERDKCEIKIPRSPGPGHYEEPARNIDKKSGGTAPYVGTGPACNSMSPGPGAYDHVDQFADFTRQTLPKHAFPRSERKWVLPTGPGPGTFEPCDYMFSRKPPTYSIGKKYVEPTDTVEKKFTTYSQFA